MVSKSEGVDIRLRENVELKDLQGQRTTKLLRNMQNKRDNPCPIALRNTVAVKYFRFGHPISRTLEHSALIARTARLFLGSLIVWYVV